MVGSFNYTGIADARNDESIVVVGDLKETVPVALQRQQQLASYALQEIDRNIQVHGISVP